MVNLSIVTKITYKIDSDGYISDSTNIEQSGIFKVINDLISLKNDGSRLKYLKEISDLIASDKYDEVALYAQLKIKLLLNRYFKDAMKAQKLNPSKTQDVEKFLLTFKGSELPYAFFLYCQAFVKRDDNNRYTYGLDHIVKKNAGDCGDVSLAAFNLLTKAGIEAKVVKAYLRYGVVREDNGENIDVHVMCFYRTDKGWNYLDNEQLMDEGRSSVKEYFNYSNLNKYVVRAIFVNTARWNKLIPEMKEPEEGPHNEKDMFYDENFFYVNKDYERFELFSDLKYRTLIK